VRSSILFLRVSCVVHDFRFNHLRQCPFFTTASKGGHAVMQRPGTGQTSWPLKVDNETSGRECCSFGKHTDVKPTSPPPTAAATPAPTQPAVVKDIEEFNKRQKEEEEAKKRQKEAEAAKPQTPLVTPEGNYKCSNKGCNKEYSPNDNSPTACKFHPGQPVFRDCMKSWTCCQAKSYDWDEFMKIEPCQTGPHVPKMFCQS
ncbi:CHORD protein, partial [Toxoplasma gondii MAS]